MNIEHNIAAAIDTILEKADEITAKQSNKLITSKVENWRNQYNGIKLTIDIPEANKSMVTLYNEMLSTVDQWERWNFSQQ